MNKFLKALGKKRPIILTGIGICGMVATAVMAYKSWPSVHTAVDDKLEEVYEEEGDDRQLTKMEVGKIYAKTLWPTVTLGAVSMIMIILGHADQVKRTSAIATAYYLSESTLKEYQEKVIEEIGEKKEREIRDRLSCSKMTKVEPNDQTIVKSDGDEPWMFDSVVGCYFRMGYEKYRRHIAEANLDMYKRDYLSVADLYYKMSVRLPGGINEWTYLGWNPRDGDIEVYMTSAIHEIMGEMVPCMVIEYKVAPKYGFDRYG